MTYPPHERWILKLIFVQPILHFFHEVLDLVACFVVPDQLRVLVRAFEHGHSSLRVVTHRIHEDDRKELGENNGDLRRRVNKSIATIKDLP